MSIASINIEISRYGLDASIYENRRPRERRREFENLAYSRC